MALLCFKVFGYVWRVIFPLCLFVTPGKANRSSWSSLPLVSGSRALNQWDVVDVIIGLGIEQVKGWKAWGGIQGRLQHQTLMEEPPSHHQDNWCSPKLADGCAECKHLDSWFQILNRGWRKKLHFQSIWSLKAQGIPGLSVESRNIMGCAGWGWSQP